MFSKTTDGGRDVVHAQPMIKSIVFVQGNQIAVLPDGTLVDIGAMLFRGSGIQPTPQQYFWTTLRSNNGGKTWGARQSGRAAGNGPADRSRTSRPDVARSDGARRGLPAGCRRRHNRPARSTWSFADSIGDRLQPRQTHQVDRRRQELDDPGGRDRDAGRHPSFNGTVEVTDDGIVAVMYYDFRSNDPSDGACSNRRLAGPLP